MAAEHYAGVSAADSVSKRQGPRTAAREISEQSANVFRGNGERCPQYDKDSEAVGFGILVSFGRDAASAPIGSIVAPATSC